MVVLVAMADQGGFLISLVLITGMLLTFWVHETDLLSLALGSVSGWKAREL